MLGVGGGLSLTAGEKKRDEDDENEFASERGAGFHKSSIALIVII